MLGGGGILPYPSYCASNVCWGGRGYFRNPLIVPVMCVGGGGYFRTPLIVPVMCVCVGGGGILSYPSYCASNVCVCWGGGYFRTPLIVPVMCVCWGGGYFRTPLTMPFSTNKQQNLIIHMWII